MSGFVPSVLSRFETQKALCGGYMNEPPLTEKRFFLLSINEPTVIKNPNTGKQSKPNKTKNRKYVSRSTEFNYGDKTYSVNINKSGIYPNIMNKLLEQLDICLDKWKRVLVVRFDLHTAFYSGDNKRVTRFRKNLLRRLQRKYGMFEVGYVWAREVEKAKSQHYHFCLFLDGSKVRHSKIILEIVDSTWKAIQHKNHVPVIPRPYHFINSPESKADAIYRISYLAKTRGKGYRDPQAKDYSTSRFTKRMRLPA